MFKTHQKGTLFALLKNPTNQASQLTSTLIKRLTFNFWPLIPQQESFWLAGRYSEIYSKPTLPETNSSHLKILNITPGKGDSGIGNHYF